MSALGGDDAPAAGRDTVGSVANSDAFSRGVGSARAPHRAARADGGVRQQAGSGQAEVNLRAASIPRNHLAWAYEVPTDRENAPRPVGWMLEVHQYVPPGLSVSWWYGLNRSSTSNTRRAAQFRHTNCPSTVPRASVGNCTSSFS